MELKKDISFSGVFSIASGAMISSGIFILPGIAFRQAGPAVCVSYFIAGILALIGVMSVIELATAMPRAGGDYFFINKTFGPLIGTVSGFLGWFALSLKSAFAIFGISEIIMIFTGLNHQLSGLVLCLVFIIVNIIGVKEAVVFQIVMVGSLIALLVIYIIFGFGSVEPSNFTPFFSEGINNVIITSGFIFISFGGLLKVANIAEEVRNPKRNIPLGMISSVIMITVLYTLIVFVITGTLSPENFRESLTPVADSARLIMGTPGYIIIITASLLAFITTANAGIMSASRYPLALGRDQLIPETFSSVNKKYNTPTLALIVTGGLIYGSLLLEIETLVKAASTVILTSYVLTNISVIILRESKISNYRPSFRAPLYPWLQLASIALFSFFIADIGLEAIEISLAFLGVCVCLYFFYGRKKYQGDYALLHLLKRIADKKITEGLLEKELREIIISRDELEQDCFDDLVKNADIMDLEYRTDFSNMVNIIAEKSSNDIGLSPKEIVSGITDRQQKFNTAVSDFLAIPHIVLDGNDKMFLMIIRSREGIKFTDKEESVKAVFFLAGTKDKRELHLKTIATIATLFSDSEFREKWLNAKNVSELRDLIILNPRKRFID